MTQSARSIVRLDDRGDRRLQRLRRIADEAARQSGRGDAPEVVVFRPDDPREVIARVAVPGLEGATITAARRTLRSDEAVLGTSDGRLAFLEVGFASDFVLANTGFIAAFASSRICAGIAPG